ncbi:unnamed protein product [Tilletia controversa]|nr:unnamed protein product [Tilletia controversa]
MKFIGAAAILALSASMAVAEPIARATPAAVKRQALPTDFSQFSDDPQVLSSYYAQATSALDQAASAGAPSSLISAQRSSLDAVFSTAFAALSSASASGFTKPTGSSSSASATSSSSKGSNSGGSPTLSFDMPVSLALTGVAGLLAAVLAL